MAHFAELDETNTVLRVVVVGNDITAIDGVEDGQRGIDFLDDLFPDSGTWVQTSYNGTFRTRYAIVGSPYDVDRDAFLGPQPFPSWALNGDTLLWEAPTPGVAGYHWDEDTLSWVQPEQPFPSWIWSDDGWWLPPIPYPGGGPQTAPFYDWDEATTSWVEITE
jgi:hypothetical protein